ncbi:hypothetical protein [Nostoc sp. UHCC 0870]|jgi:hypothetical protein|uniref:hypothetical protein n=1 Tax=Nostoc sp. UHCC 0870 TaxID=2914041 RepID=UPI001EDFD3AF|nr:hypothetical protein [Nostoc sp. UHCC 0870]UKP00357.1 hypothetical protein L6494_11930 [Nostoc sp. UHCC 0870]
MTTCISTIAERNSQAVRVRELTKTCYQDDQQVKFMSLQAEVDSLWQELQNLKEKRLTTTSPES